MPVRKYQSIYDPNLSRPNLPSMPESTRPANWSDFLMVASKGAKDGFDNYQSRVAKQIQMEMEAERLEREREKAMQEKAANEGRSKFRQDLIGGNQTPILHEPSQAEQGMSGPELPDAYNGMPFNNPRQIGIDRKELNGPEMVDSYLKNVPMTDDSDAKGMMGLLIDKNKPAGLKMKEVTDAYDAELLKKIEVYKQQNNGSYPPKDIQEQMALEIGGSNYAKLVKQSTSKETSWDEKKQTDTNEQRDIGNNLAKDRLALSKQNFELSVGKDYRSDVQEYGKKITDLTSVETHLKPIEKKIASGADMISSKVFSNDVGQFLQNLAGEDPELSVELGYLASAYIKMISGAAVNEGEAVRLLSTVGVNIWSSKDRLKAGIQGMRNELDAKKNVLETSYDRVLDHYSKEKKPSAAAPGKTAPKKTADDYLKDLEF